MNVHDLIPLSWSWWLAAHPEVEFLLWMVMPLLFWAALYFALWWVPRAEKEKAALRQDEICPQCGRKVSSEALAYHQARTCPKRPKGFRVGRAFGSGENVDRLGSRHRRK